MDSYAKVRGSIADACNSRMLSLGYECVDNKKYVNSAHAPIRKVVELEALRGGDFQFHPAFSLDFVPHASGARLCWHKTPKKARWDVSLNQFDFGDQFDRYIIECAWKEPPKSIVLGVLDRFLSELFRELEAVKTLPDLVPVIDRLMAHKPRRFGFYNYTQHPVAAAFVFARVGDVRRAREEIAKWTDINRLISTDFKRLQCLFAEALRGGGS